MKRQPGARTLGQAPTSGGVAELGAGGGGCTCGLSPTTHPAFWTLTLATGHTRGTAHPSGQGFTSHCTEYTCPTARRTDTQMWLSWGQESRGPPLGPRAPLLGGARPVRPPSQHPSPTRPQRQRQEETRFPCPRQVWALRAHLPAYTEKSTINTTAPPMSTRAPRWWPSSPGCGLHDAAPGAARGCGAFCQRGGWRRHSTRHSPAQRRLHSACRYSENGGNMPRSAKSSML